VKANASTVHTLIQSELAEGSLSDVLDEIDCTTESCANMRNPFNDNDSIVAVGAPSTTAGDNTPGVVHIEDVSPTLGDGIKFEIVGIGADGDPIEATLTAQR